jgi:predicted lactoylglutathione lyase
MLRFSPCTWTRQPLEVACSSREQVDSLVAKARAGGGKVPREPQDHGFMYAHGYEDLDGHTWELVHMTGEPPKQ